MTEAARDNATALAREILNQLTGANLSLQATSEHVEGPPPGDQGSPPDDGQECLLGLLEKCAGAAVATRAHAENLARSLGVEPRALIAVPAKGCSPGPLKHPCRA